MAASSPVCASASLEDKLEKRKGVKYRPPKFNYVETPTEKLDYFLVLDFEAVINKDPGSPDVMEMIEFPVLKINAKTLETESIFHTYVQPVIHKKVNPVCTELTGITQEMVDGQPTLPETLAMLDEWMKKEGLLEKGVNFCFVTCGDWDLKKGLPVNCDYLDIAYPDYLKRWINIKSYFQADEDYAPRSEANAGRETPQRNRRLQEHCKDSERAREAEREASSRTGWTQSTEKTVKITNLYYDCTCNKMIMQACLLCPYAYV